MLPFPNIFSSSISPQHVRVRTRVRAHTHTHTHTHTLSLSLSLSLTYTLPEPFRKTFRKTGKNSDCALMFYLIVSPKQYVQCLTNYKPENSGHLCANFKMTYVKQDYMVRWITNRSLSYREIHHTIPSSVKHL